MKLFTNIPVSFTRTSAIHKKPWEMTRSEIEDILRTGSTEDMPKLREVLHALKWDEGYSRANDPWGTWRTVHVGDEFPRVPLVELSRRRRAMVNEAVERGDTVPRDVLSELGVKPAQQTIRKAQTDRDEAYLKAVEDGDMETAQRMVDESAKASGYNVTVFRGGSMDKRYPWFTEDEKEAAKYGTPRKYMLKVTNYMDVSGGFSTSILVEKGHDAARLLDPMSYEGNYGGQKPQWVPLFKKQIKSADPVTYDDQKNVIPLSERFNSSSPDIRY